MEEPNCGSTPHRGKRAPPSTARAYHHRRLREALSEAALAEIRLGGPKGLSLRAVAARVGVSPTAPYRHFRNKEGLLAALAAERFVEMPREMEEAGARIADAWEQLCILGRVYVSFAMSHPDHFRLMFGPELAEIERHPEAHEAADRAFALLDLSSKTWTGLRRV
ncbi:protein of unknown function [Methylacidimicrobium sp. AP8]|uniref:TetR/AcrR family transcriptional regulator n=1 Tax=Methylacidimicrobium sp. AP8 TaxID=2730359 RepID=UPI0018C189D0|nr:TetR/AcrR family transcriptional regulator [Methylacidimicrobium sp. AP8]CAB4243751.1 protein of unknown function [Methylacidimicrobium sp. AP8]